MKIRIHTLGFLFCLLIAACAQEESIFPTADVSLASDAVFLPNPIALAVNEATSQLYVVNSNVDFFASNSTLTVIDVDASDPASPVLTASQALTIPNYAAQSYFDGADLYVAFRESSTTDASQDTFRRFHVDGTALALADTVNIADDPFGVTLSGDNFYIVSEDVLSVVSKDFATVATIDLSAAGGGDFDETNTTFVEGVAVNADATQAFVSNRGDDLLLVDLTSQDVQAVVDDLRQTRDLLVDATDPNRVYAVDSNAEAVQVLDFTLLADEDASDFPTVLDDSDVLLATIGVGQDPNGLLLDAVHSRLYVCNSFDDTVSVIDTVSLTELARISLNAADLPSAFTRDIQDPLAMALGDFNGEAYLFVAGFSSHSIAVIRVSDYAVLQTYPDNDLHFSDDPDDEDDD